MSNKELVKELRCLRMHLVGFVVNEKLSLIEEAEQRLSKNGAVSTDPATTGNKGKKNQQGHRITKKNAFQQFLHK